jgi:hypothetical protein
VEHVSSLLVELGHDPFTINAAMTAPANPRPATIRPPIKPAKI